MIKLNALDTDPAKGERPMLFLAVFDDTGKPIGTEIGQYIDRSPGNTMDRSEAILRMFHMTAKKVSLEEVRTLRKIFDGE